MSTHEDPPPPLRGRNRRIPVIVPSADEDGTPMTIWTTIPDGMTDDEVRESMLAWATERRAEGPFGPPQPPPRRGVRVQLVLRACVAEERSLIEVSLAARDVDDGQCVMRWAQVGPRRRALQAYEAFRRNGRELAFAGGFTVVGEVLERGFWSGRAL